MSGSTGTQEVISGERLNMALGELSENTMLKLVARNGGRQVMEVAKSFGWNRDSEPILTTCLVMHPSEPKKFVCECNMPCGPRGRRASAWLHVTVALAACVELESAIGAECKSLILPGLQRAFCRRCAFSDSNGDHSICRKRIFRVSV